MTAQRIVRSARLVLSLTFAALAITVISVGVSARIAPAIGYELFSIRSGSMDPALPVGSLAAVSRSDTVEVDDPVAFRLPNGAVVTHRVVEVVEADDGRYLRTKGDANEDPDPSLVPAASIVGPVVISIPLLGFLLAMLGMPIGVVAIISVAGTLLTAIWLLEEFEDLEELDEPDARPGIVPSAGGSPPR
jgi:signal peptidase